ncbi:DUF2637 domain-containing protein [Leucobacter musarum]|uniref:DUF2637 domain-containing protein n=1 Tax=Leucobacter musarum TaxID=1930747 RepID=UPI0006A7EDA7|nr:DUF2637 domain-containing protein [Leucobacter musarum]
MAKKTRTWAHVLTLGIPLAVVGVAAMAVSYATLIDVAAVNGLPLPELFPVIIDVGSISCMVAAARSKNEGTRGRWLSHTTFFLLSVVSIMANASHAGRAADLALTSPWIAALIAAVPPFVMLSVTHQVMMTVPDEKERARIRAARERLDAAAVKRMPEAPAVDAGRPAPALGVTASAVSVPQRPVVMAAHTVPADTHLEDTVPVPLRIVSDDTGEIPEAVVRDRVLEFVDAEQKRPTGKLVGEWLGGKTPKTGQRFLKKMEDEGDFDTVPELLAAP